MTTKYGSFPGVQVEVSGGGITAVSVGDEDNLVIFGQASYQNDSDFSPGDGNEDPLESSLTGSTETAEQINSRSGADTKFGSGSELADGMREALANGANIDFLYGVAPKRYNVVDETQGTQTGTLNNAPLWEEEVSDDSNIAAVDVTDDGAGSINDIEFTYESPSAPGSATETIVINPITGEYAADAAPDGDYQVSYKYLDWSSAFTVNSVVNAVAEGETGIYLPIVESDSVSSTIDTEVSTLRTDEFKMISVLSGAEPNSVEVITTDGNSLANDHSNYQRRDARYNTGSFSQGSVDSDYYFKAAPVRLENVPKTVLGGVGGLFAGNSISNPIYNDEVQGYDTLEQSLTKTEANDLRGENVIPIRQAGTIRVKDNLSTSTSTDWERDFWRRRIADQVILIAKSVGDSIIGEINDEQTRGAARRLIQSEMRELVSDRLIKPNDEEKNWFVDVTEDQNNPNQVNIDIGFTPFGVVKRIEETITINT